MSGQVGMISIILHRFSLAARVMSWQDTGESREGPLVCRHPGKERVLGPKWAILGAELQGRESAWQVAGLYLSALLPAEGAFGLQWWFRSCLSLPLPHSLLLYFWLVAQGTLGIVLITVWVFIRWLSYARWYCSFLLFLWFSLICFQNSPKTIMESPQL